jgi:hypothetical protein
MPKKDDNGLGYTDCLIISKTFGYTLDKKILTMFMKQASCGLLEEELKKDKPEEHFYNYQGRAISTTIYKISSHAAISTSYHCQNVYVGIFYLQSYHLRWLWKLVKKHDFRKLWEIGIMLL